jgi:hypothetical protein
LLDAYTRNFNGDGALDLALINLEAGSYDAATAA